MFPMAVCHPFPAEVVQRAVYALFGRDGHDVGWPVEGHLRGNFRGAKAKKLDFTRGKLRRRSGIRRRAFGSGNC